MIAMCVCVFFFHSVHSTAKTTEEKTFSIFLAHSIVFITRFDLVTDVDDQLEFYSCYACNIVSYCINLFQYLMFNSNKMH